MFSAFFAQQIKRDLWDFIPHLLYQIYIRGCRSNAFFACQTETLFEIYFKSEVYLRATLYDKIYNILKYFRHAPLYIYWVFSNMVELRVFSWSHFMFVYNEKRLAAVNFDHAVRLDVIMALAFFNNLHLNHGCLFQFKNIQFHLVAIRPNSSKNTKILAVIVYLHSQTQCFFVDVSFKFSTTRCRYTAYGNLAILMSLKQCVTGYLLTLQDFVF